MHWVSATPVGAWKFNCSVTGHRLVEDIAGNGNTPDRLPAFADSLSDQRFKLLLSCALQDCICNDNRHIDLQKDEQTQRL